MPPLRGVQGEVRERISCKAMRRKDLKSLTTLSTALILAPWTAALSHKVLMTFSAWRQYAR